MSRLHDGKRENWRSVLISGPESAWYEGSRDCIGRRSSDGGRPPFANIPASASTFHSSGYSISRRRIALPSYSFLSYQWIRIQSATPLSFLAPFGEIAAANTESQSGCIPHRRFLITSIGIHSRLRRWGEIFCASDEYQRLLTFISLLAISAIGSPG